MTVRDELAQRLCDVDATNGAATWDEADEQGRDDYRRMADVALDFAAEELRAAAKHDRMPVNGRNVLRTRAGALEALLRADPRITS